MTSVIPRPRKKEGVRRELRSTATESSNNETTSIVLGDVGSDLQDAVGSVIADQVSIAPTIYVDQGASVTVLVDRDVVIY